MPVFLHSAWTYAGLSAAALIEGPLVSLAAGSLARLGQLSIPLVIVSLAFGELVGDVIWYFIGRGPGIRFLRRYGKYVGLREEDVTAATWLFRKYHLRILFISKLTFGLGFAIAVLFTSGLSHVPFGRFVAICALGQLLWSSLLVGVGYFFGVLITAHSGHGHLYLLAGAYLLVILFMLRFGRYLRPWMLNLHERHTAHEN